MSDFDPLLIKCEYCGQEKVRVAYDINGSGEKRILMYSHKMPYHSDNPVLEAWGFNNSQVWICIDCIENMK